MTVHSVVRRVGVLVLACALLPAVTPATAASEPGDGVPSGVVVVEGQDVPILGSFTFREGWDPQRAEVVGFVHGVRRVDGGTVVYYSMGSTPDTREDTFVGLDAFQSPAPPYDPSSASEIAVVDLTNTTMYTPLRNEETTFTTRLPDIRADRGELVVGWAMFPELPASTSTVQVRMPSGTIVPGIPVEDGALAEGAPGRCARRCGPGCGHVDAAASLR
jgi:OOP family OmpA-OmpF porin